MSYRIFVSGRFRREYKKCLKRGLDENAFLKVISILSATGTLPPEYRPHKLVSNYNGCWECHIEPDWLLIWKQNNEELTLLLVATGSHSDLFG